ncbi:MipA/OmpV family protein [Rahnella sp. SAP-1]|uniref:MipA/OmpV family protein n=1 Tax=Rouxiella aceris TaxID=2703884 RepID=A0A848MIC9_9GAMM|nr:MipA/OmpV family protein [Rouxiella aceris]NMP26732.1 MipA/OmpV family protein [Rouxiella aceris]
MKALPIKALPVAALLALLSQSAQADSWSLGASALVSPDPYRGYDTKFFPVPIINYEGDSFYFRSLMAGYYLWKDQQNQLSLVAGYNPFGFKPSDSDDEQMKRLDKRRGTLMAGVAFSHQEQWGTLRTSLTGDTLNNSNGMVGDLAYLYTFKGDNWALVPGLGLTWNSANQNKYYYGISGAESRRSGLDSYQPGDSFNPYLELSARYNFTPQWQAFFTGRYIRLATEVTDSPMVDKSYTGVVWTGITYNF